MNAKKRTIRRSLKNTAAVILMATPGLASAQTSDIAALEARIATLESAGSVVARPGTKVTVGGYVKLDFIYDLDEGLGDSFGIDSISVGTATDNARFRAHARQSRFFLKSETATSSGPVKTNFELDLFGTGGNEIFSNSHAPRLRHASATWNGWLAGQSWSNFMPIESYPSTIDFNGPAGIPFIRQAQLRYSWDAGGGLNLSASLENSEFSGRNASGRISESTTSGINAGLDGLPDVTLAARYAGDGYFAKAAFVGRDLNSPTSNDSAFGYGLSLSGNADLWEGGKIIGSFTTGDGIGRYNVNGAGQDAFVDAAGNLTTITSTGGSLALSQSLTDSLTAGLAFGHYTVDETFAATDTKNLTTVHASLFWKAADTITIGLEGIYGERELANGQSDDAMRLQTSFQVNF